MLNEGRIFMNEYVKDSAREAIRLINSKDRKTPAESAAFHALQHLLDAVQELENRNVYLEACVEGFTQLVKKEVLKR